MVIIGFYREKHIERFKGLFFPVEGGESEVTDRAKLIDSFALVVVLQSI